ncbi:Apyrase, partial [Operophtera brumata]
ALGNHEFDDGPKGLAPYLKALKAPVVAANLDTTNEPTLQGLYQAHTVVERNGRKIGIIGLITPDTKGVDIIILLSHCGLDVDNRWSHSLVAVEWSHPFRGGSRGTLSGTGGDSLTYQTQENTVVGETETTLFYQDCVYGECTLGNLIIKGMIEYRETEKETYYALELEANVDDALERSVSDAWAYKPFKGPWVLQVGGLHVTYNVSQPQGSRITSLFLGDCNSTTPLEPSAYYHVVMTSYLAHGGDGFTMFNDNKINTKIIGRNSDILAEYIVKHSPLNITTQGRITINN